MKNKKIILSIVASIALIVLIIGATYAYFQAQTGEGAQTDIKINANTVDTFTFEVGSALNLSLNQENFASGKGNQTGTTFAKAMLTANNKTNTATEHYYLYLNISKNTFTYSIDNNTPEILLSIKDGSNNEITIVSGLTYKTVTDGKGASIKGFDITTKTGLVTILNNREITTTSSKTEEWNITVIFVNYNSNQAGNAGKNFSAKLMIQKEEYKQTLAEYVKSQYTGTQGENSLYYHNSSLTNGAGDNSYRYAGASESVNNFVCFGSTETPCPTDNLYRTIGVIDGKVKLIKYDYATSTLLGTDGDYQESWTPDASTYKGSLTSIDKYSWNYKATNSASNTWSTSLLNKTNLNTNFINKIGSAWANKIAITTWKVGGGASENIYSSVPATAYQYEVGSSASSTTYDAKIGLMYVSDYYYSASPSDWTLVGYNIRDSTKDYRAATGNNWMYMGYTEWTISRDSVSSNYAFTVFINGNVSNYVGTDSSIGVRPSFNLESSVKYVSGSGSKSNPIRIN